MLSLTLILLLGILWGGLAIASRRFERRRLREGAWNKHGPKDPTFAPPNPALRGAAIDLPTIEAGPSSPSTSVPAPSRPDDR